MSGLVIVGADVLGRLAAESAELAGEQVAGFVDDRPGAGSLGTTADLPALQTEGLSLAYVAIGDNARRREVSERVRAAGFSLATIVHPRAFVSPAAILDAGVLVEAFASVHAGARVGDGAVLMPHSWVAHDAEVGEYAWLSGHAAVGGFARLGGGCRIGVGAVVGAHAQVAHQSVVGAGERVERRG